MILYFRLIMLFLESKYKRNLVRYNDFIQKKPKWT
ncbi:hypothetical protein PARMER_01372 [Parabacteroides merdae ATCC 43184]|nr:hypothetical protein PARMER_01372 [Parabacteroides merdae ATCC 43184]